MREPAPSTTLPRTSALAPHRDPPRYGRLRDVGPLRGFAAPATLSLAERIAVVDRALTLLAELYVHLPLKRAMYAVDPEAELRRLRRELLGVAADPSGVEPDERAFHDRLLAAFVALRDLHTTYVLPEPWRSHVAFLPLLIEECHRGAPATDDEAALAAARAYVVTRVRPGVDVPAGAEVTHVNAVPIALAVERSAERHAGGGNPDARRARGLERLTYRWLGGAPLPDEDWVVLTLAGEDAPRDVRLEWLVGRLPRDPAGGERAPHRRTTRPSDLRRGQDPQGEAARRVRTELWARPGRRVAGAGTVALRRFPDPRTGPYAHLRIHSFDVPDPVAWAADLARRLARAPRGGLVVDVRGNPGGDIGAAELLLQLFTPGPIAGAPLHFRATPTAVQLARRLREAGEAIGEDVEASLRAALATGAPFSRGAPLLAAVDLNAVGQVYQGPVVCVVDAMTYSAADLFAAGVADHPHGVVLGTAGHTGAGGANAMSAETLAGCLPDAGLDGPPDGPSFQLAVRRSTRVGPMADVVLEDFGVVPDVRYALTPGDVQGDNAALLAFTAQLLDASGPAPRLRARAIRGGDAVGLEAEGLSRVDAFLDDRPWASIDPATTREVALGGARGVLHLLGHDASGAPAVSVRVSLPADT
ncbi:MAG: hypothetical protein QOH43_4745 [Solirubrobacteraceae bacterium]|nr:hypothetical protein [Solirubrobacteraceae bacterium]